MPSKNFALFSVKMSSLKRKSITVIKNLWKKTKALEQQLNFHEKISENDFASKAEVWSVKILSNHVLTIKKT